MALEGRTVADELFASEVWDGRKEFRLSLEPIQILGDDLLPGAIYPNLEWIAPFGGAANENTISVVNGSQSFVEVDDGGGLHLGFLWSVHRVLGSMGIVAGVQLGVKFRGFFVIWDVKMGGLGKHFRKIVKVCNRIRWVLFGICGRGRSFVHGVLGVLGGIIGKSRGIFGAFLLSWVR